MVHAERLNGYTHLAGAVLAAAGGAALVAIATARGDPLRITSFSIYAATLFAMYVASTFYHSTEGRLKALFRKLDHSAIYLVIAGSYTPLALVTLKGHDGWLLFAGVWTLAIFGIGQELWLARGARVSSLAIYLTMGWMGLALLHPLALGLTVEGIRWLLGAGVVYTAGVVFYLFDHRYAYGHAVWHVFVLVGSALHYAALLKFVA